MGSFAFLVRPQAKREDGSRLLRCVIASSVCCVMERQINAVLRDAQDTAFTQQQAAEDLKEFDSSCDVEV